MKIKAERVWLHESVRYLCFRKNWYTRRNEKEYQEMLSYIETHKPTPTAIYKVALNIKTHSNIEESVSYIMNDIEKFCVNTFYSLPEETEVR